MSQHYWFCRKNFRKRKKYIGVPIHTEDQLDKINDLICAQTDEQNHHPAQMPTLKVSIAALSQFKKLTQSMDVLSVIQSIETDHQFQLVFQTGSKTQQLVDEIKS